MVEPSRILLQEILKRKFNYHLVVINQFGEEKELHYKKNKKEFLRQIESIPIMVVLVDTYPRREDWKENIYYLSKTGKSLYYKTSEMTMPEEVLYGENYSGTN